MLLIDYGKHITKLLISFCFDKRDAHRDGEIDSVFKLSQIMPFDRVYRIVFPNGKRETG